MLLIIITVAKSAPPARDCRWRSFPAGMSANPGGATGAIAPPRICQKGLNIA